MREEEGLGERRVIQTSNEGEEAEGWETLRYEIKRKRRGRRKGQGTERKGEDSGKIQKGREEDGQNGKKNATHRQEKTRDRETVEERDRKTI